MSKLEIHFNEVDTAISVMREVAAWGREQGYRVWPDAQPENFCVGTIDGEIAYAFILQWADGNYWPNAPEYEAAYLHKFCVRRKFAGMGMTKLATEAIHAECRNRGIRYIRLDTGLDEKVVRKIYLSAGYKIVDILDYPQ